jgi:putative heme iron utilization protein
MTIKRLEDSANIELLMELLQLKKTATLATLNIEHLPEASLCPFIYHQECFWVFVSRLSSHTANLLERTYASLLICVDEVDSNNPFTIRRVSIQCQAIEQPVDENILELMRVKLGDTVTMLKQLPDFHLIKLVPKEGRFILGFGQAYEIDFDKLELTHINPSKG